MALHVLAHVEANDGVAAAKVVVGKGAHQLRLANARGADEEQRRDRALGVAQPAARARERGRDGGAGVVLADHARLERLGLKKVGG